MHGAGSEHASLRDARRSRSRGAVRAAQEVARVVHQVAPDLHQDERHERGDRVRPPRRPLRGGERRADGEGNHRRGERLRARRRDASGEVAGKTPSVHPGGAMRVVDGTVRGLQRQTFIPRLRLRGRAPPLAHRALSRRDAESSDASPAIKSSSSLSHFRYRCYSRRAGRVSRYHRARCDREARAEPRSRLSRRACCFASRSRARALTGRAKGTWARPSIVDTPRPRLLLFAGARRPSTPPRAGRARISLPNTSSALPPRALR